MNRERGTLTATRDSNVNTPRREKYSTKVGRLNKIRRSSRERVGSGTIPKTAIRMAPPATRTVPRSIQIENASPNSMRAKNAFHKRETAPRGARMTTGSDAIWTIDPKRFEEMKMPIDVGQKSMLGN